VAIAEDREISLPVDRNLELLEDRFLVENQLDAGAGSGQMPSSTGHHWTSANAHGRMTPGRRGVGRRNPAGQPDRRRPSCLKTARIAAASTSVMTNIPQAWWCAPWLASATTLHQKFASKKPSCIKARCKGMERSFTPSPACFEGLSQHICIAGSRLENILSRRGAVPPDNGRYHA
jgi:hypothetical protein